MRNLAARFFVVGVVVTGTAAGAAVSANAAQQASSAQNYPSAMTLQAPSARDIWAACCMRDSANKMVRVFPRRGVRGLPGGRSELKCGTRSWGYRHVKFRHMSDWRRDAS